MVYVRVGSVRCSNKHIINKWPSLEENLCNFTDLDYISYKNT